MPPRNIIPYLVVIDPMMTLVISLPTSADRRRKMADGLKAAGLPYRVIDGVVGKDLSRTELQHWAPHRFMARFGRELGPGEIGCTLSHRIALETFLTSEESTALILEDDAIVLPNVREAIKAILGRLPEGWGLLKIGGIGGVRGKLHCETAFGKIVATPAVTVCSHAYIVSRQGAAQLLKKIHPIKFPYDIYLRDVYYHRAKTFEVVPTLVEQADLAGSKLAVERAESIRSFRLRQALAYPVWKLNHELTRRGHLFSTFGMRAALSPSRLKRHF
jgi:glycosyl transferase family 25